jgi:S1-C subfamily serine protease
LLEVLKIVADLSLTKFRVYKTYVIIRDANDKLAFNEIYDLEDWKLEAKRLFPDLRDERRPLFKAVTLEVTNRAQSQPDFFTDPTWPVKLTTVVAARNGIVPDIHHPSINILEYTPNLENRDDQPNTTVDSAKDIAKRSLPSVFTVLVTRPTGEVISQGSAFLITPKHLITNVHVIDAGKNSDIYVLNSNFDDPIPVVAIPGLNDQADLAVLEVDVHLGTALPLAPNEPEIGETIFAVGTPKGLDGTFSTGIVSGFRDYAGIEHLQISAPISPGSSGGPVLNSLGEVIGVAVSTVESGQNLNFAVPTDYILDLIDTILTE